jgi:site-specific DNA-cytosine methylase
MNLELFPCSGGMAEGFRRAGITFDWAFDKDPNACASYEKNMGHRPVQMDARDLLRMARGGWSPGPVRLLVAELARARLAAEAMGPGMGVRDLDVGQVPLFGAGT